VTSRKEEGGEINEVTGRKSLWWPHRGRKKSSSERARTGSKSFGRKRRMGAEHQRKQGGKAPKE